MEIARDVRFTPTFKFNAKKPSAAKTIFACRTIKEKLEGNDWLDAENFSEDDSLCLEEREKIRVDLVLMRSAQAVRCALVDLECCVLDDL
jgi:hypothetical protein